MGSSNLARIRLLRSFLRFFILRLELKLTLMLSHE
ncbi:hypothetical protein LINPERPRIM_LOCUS1201 [Linum perenne]